MGACSLHRGTRALATIHNLRTCNLICINNITAMTPQYKYVGTSGLHVACTRKTNYVLTSCVLREHRRSGAKVANDILYILCTWMPQPNYEQQAKTNQPNLTTNNKSLEV